MSRLLRQGLIKQIQSKRNSKVISYILNTRSGIDAKHVLADVNNFCSLLENLDLDTCDLDVIIHSFGGSTEVSWSLISKIRQYCGKNFNIIIPECSLSAGTMIALAADEIIMGKRSELGPINPTVNNLSYDDLKSFYNLFDSSSFKENADCMKSLVENYRPTDLGQIQKFLLETLYVCERILKLRKNPLSDNENANIIDCFSSKIPSHEHRIARNEALDYGVNYITFLENTDIENEVNELFGLYSDLLCLETDFTPLGYLHANDLEEYTWNDIKFVCLESENSTIYYEADIHYKRIRDIPPQVDLNLSHNFPNITLPPSHVNLTKDEIEHHVKTVISVILTQLCNETSKNYFKSRRIIDNIKTIFNNKWRKEM